MLDCYLEAVIGNRQFLAVFCVVLTVPSWSDESSPKGTTN